MYLFYKERLDAIIEASPGHVFVQVIGAEDTDDMIAQARWLASKSEKMIVKLPMDPCGKAGADIVALFNGPLDTTSDTPVEIVEKWPTA